MPVDITPVSEWTTLQEPAGSDVANRAGLLNMGQRLANRVEFLKDVALGGVTSWPQTGVAISVPLVSGRVRNGDTIQWLIDNTDWVGSCDLWKAASDGAILTLSPSEELRAGMTITGFWVHVAAGHTRTSTDKIKADLRYHDTSLMHGTGNPLASTSIGSASDGGTAGPQFIDVGSLAHLVSRNHRDYQLRVKFGAGVSGAASFADYLFAAGLIVTNPGPRNP